MRKWWRITDLNNENPWTIPKFDYSEDGISYQFRNILRASPNRDGSLDMFGDRRGLRTEARASLAFTLVSSCAADLKDEIASMLAAFEGDSVSKGLRKLWRWEDPSGLGRRFAFGRLRERPKMPTQFSQRTLPVNVDLVMPDPLLYSPLSALGLVAAGYVAEDIPLAIVGEPINPELTFAKFAAVTTSPKALTIVNEGDQISTFLIFRFESISADGFSNIVITNNTTGEALSTPRDAASANDIWQVNARPGLARAQYSTDLGATFVDDTRSLSLGTLQGLPMSLAPGSNSISITCAGTPNYDLFVWWRHAWRD